MVKKTGLAVLLQWDTTGKVCFVGEAKQPVPRKRITRNSDAELRV
jgi:hypothetical protein